MQAPVSRGSRQTSATFPHKLFSTSTDEDGNPKRGAITFDPAENSLKLKTIPLPKSGKQ